MVDPPLKLSSICHDPDPMEETLEWFMHPMVKVNSSTPQDDPIILNLNPKSHSIESITFLRDICHPPSSTCHYSLYRDLLNQFAPPNSYSHSLDYQFVGSNCDRVQGIHIT